MPAVSTQIPGFASPVFDAQAVFRGVLDALSQPGRIWALPIECEAPESLSPATAAICLCLLDQTTSLWLDPALERAPIESFLKFHTGCAIADNPSDADFAIVSSPDRSEMFAAFRQGSPEYPDQSTTVMLQIKGFEEEAGVTLRGPGIEASERLGILGAGTDFWAAIRQNNEQFPLGIDFILVADRHIVGLPRSTRVED